MTPRGRPKPNDAKPVTADAPSLEVQVIWGDITSVKADVYVSGHYENVLPLNAEHALDRLVSGKAPGDPVDDTFVLRNLTRRGVLRGALGNVEFFPCAPREEGRCLVAIAGMGHPGTFGPPELRRLSRNLAWALNVLPEVGTVCSVLIGGGAGNLSTAEAVAGLITGVADALEPRAAPTPIKRLCLAELELGKARAIHRTLVDLASSSEIKRRLKLEVLEIDESGGRGGTVGDAYCMALTLAAAASAARGSETAKGRQALATLLSAVDHPERFEETAVDAFSKLIADDAGGLSEVAAGLTVELRPRGSGPPVPTRISFVRDGATIRAAALTETAVTPERPLGIDEPLLNELVAEMTDPEPNDVRTLSADLNRIVIPRDFREPIERARTLVFEVDRAMANVHWEMLSDRADSSDDAVPIALKIGVARQLRTTYSPSPAAERFAGRPLRALVVGDPGDPGRRENLVEAQQEAIEIAEFLASKGVEVTLMVGAPSAERAGALEGKPPAKRLHVLNKLTTGGYDLLHFAGHADFDPKDPDITGWVFEGGLLTSRLLELVDLAPSLVFANACLSANTSEALRSGRRTSAAKTEADLLPGLADEFFHRGVRNYIGTAWKVDDEGAREFAKTFYARFIPSPDDSRATPIGEALLQARKSLKSKDQDYGALWAAYQHYGDPQYCLSIPGPQAGRR